MTLRPDGVHPQEVVDALRDELAAIIAWARSQGCDLCAHRGAPMDRACNMARPRLGIPCDGWSPGWSEEGRQLDRFRRAVREAMI